jgi:ribosomal protein S27AE
MQVLPARGVITGGMEDNLVQVDRVRCLECGATYSKLAQGGTVSRNPGCPRCGYLGWILATIPPRPAVSQDGSHRSAGDPPLHLRARPH